LGRAEENGESGGGKENATNINEHNTLERVAVMMMMMMMMLVMM
jgi:hypothetical protein